MYEGALCICCMSTENLNELFTSRAANGGVENYAKMLKSCLNIEITVRNDMEDYICESCTSKLKECVAFKKQTLKSISIISSINITELVSSADMNVLGLDNRNDFCHGHSNNVVIDKDNEITEENKTVEDINKVEFFYEEVIKSSTPKPNQSRLSTRQRPEKKQLGRPRKYPKDYIPYKIEKHELKCRECGEEFPTHITLKVHYNTHFRNHVCRTCDKGFMTNTSLKKHETSHLRGPFTCGACGQEYANINSLNSHRRLKHGAPLPYRCGECGAAFATFARRVAHAAAEHARTERRHRCRLCAAAFMHSGELAKHRARRHEVKLEICPMCDYSAPRDALKTHLARVHGRGERRRCTNERRFVCRLCGQAFVQKCTLEYHIGAHVRNEEYSGDPGYLVVVKNKQDDKHAGLLEDVESLEEEESLEEQYLDEDLLSEDQELELNESIEGFLLDEEQLCKIADGDLGVDSALPSDDVIE